MERVLFLGSVAAVVSVAALAEVPSGAWSWVAVAAAVAALGLPHGALDARVARDAFGLDGRGVAGFAAMYLAAAGATALVWVAAPVLALAAFLAYAAFHFGQDWTARPGIALLFGTALLTMPAVRFEAEVAAIFEAMTGGGASVASVMHWIAPAAGLSALLVALRQGGAAVELGAWGALALAVPPHVAFAVYFCTLHSPRHFREASQRLGLSTREALGDAIPWALPVAALGAGAAVWLDSGGAGAVDALAFIIFTGLACLTVPHMALEEIVARPRARAFVARLSEGTSRPAGAWSGRRE